jgi:hypothetical protein
MIIHHLLKYETITTKNKIYYKNNQYIINDIIRLQSSEVGDKSRYSDVYLLLVNKYGEMELVPAHNGDFIVLDKKSKKLLKDIEKLRAELSSHNINKYGLY